MRSIWLLISQPGDYVHPVDSKRSCCSFLWDSPFNRANDVDRSATGDLCRLLFRRVRKCLRRRGWEWTVRRRRGESQNALNTLGQDQYAPNALRADFHAAICGPDLPPFAVCYRCGCFTRLNILRGGRRTVSVSVFPCNMINIW